MANPAITNGKPTTIKKTRAPSRSESLSGSQDIAYLVNVAVSKTKINAPITRGSTSVLSPKKNLILRCGDLDAVSSVKKHKKFLSSRIAPRARLFQSQTAVASDRADFVTDARSS